MLDDVDIPIYYVVNRGLKPEQAQVVLGALRITPVYCAVVTDILDASLALQLASEVIRTKSLSEAHQLAAKIWGDTGRRALVIGDADVLDAVYEDGRTEPVVHSC